jgi:uncharacterized peroxidase-related enzyme
MRLRTYSSGRRRIQRAVIGLTRLVGTELDDVGKTALRRPDFFGKPFLDLTQATLRGPSRWSVGERELFAAVVSSANSCQFCVGTHAEIAGKKLHADVLADWQNGRFGPKATAAARFVDALTRSPQSLTAEDVQQTRAAGVDDIALVEAIYVAFVFNTINRIADALGFAHRSDRDRRRGAAILRRNGYRVPKFLLR